MRIALAFGPWERREEGYGSERMVVQAMAYACDAEAVLCPVQW